MKNLSYFLNENFKLPSFEQFKKTFSKSSGKPERRFFVTYGDISFEDAYQIYSKEILQKFGYLEKIQKFEKFLINNGYDVEHSKKSESRYYRYQNKIYRFSSHYYPTGSLTNNQTIDLVADPHLINDVKF